MIQEATSRRRNSDAAHQQELQDLEQSMTLRAEEQAAEERQSRLAAIDEVLTTATSRLYKAVGTAIAWDKL